jgi:RimJ/RimL family protein N-acetyltransferase
MRLKGPAIRRFDAPAPFAARVEPWLVEREAEHNILLGILPKLVAGLNEYQPPVYLASIEREGLVCGCAFRTPPYKMGLTRFPADAVEPLVEDVARVYDALPAVLGREEDAGRFADAWSRRAGLKWSFGSRMRIHQLDALVEPATMPAGRLRAARDDERALVVAWLDAFVEDTGIGGAGGAAIAEVLLAEGQAFLWDDRGPKALVGVPGFTPHGARVGYVYTPPDDRGRGYATAATAALSRRLLDSGRRFCVLFTDLANPISNRIYARLGYVPVCDVVDAVFTAG